MSQMRGPGPAIDEDRVIGGYVVVADHLVASGVGIGELPGRAFWGDVAERRVVQAPQQPRRAGEDLVGPHVRREGVGADLAGDKGQDFAPLVVDTEDAGGAVESPRFE